jgi:hypothetical protein
LSSQGILALNTQSLCFLKTYLLHSNTFHFVNKEIDSKENEWLNQGPKVALEIIQPDFFRENKNGLSGLVLQVPIGSFFLGVIRGVGGGHSLKMLSQQQASITQ